MIYAVEIKLWCGKQYVELDEPVDTIEEAERLAIDVIKQSISSAEVAQTYRTGE